MSGHLSLDKFSSVFASTYAYSDGLLAALQHLLVLSAGADTSTKSAWLDQSQFASLLSQTRAANRLMGCSNSVQWFLSVCAEAVDPRADFSAPGLLLRRLNQLKALLMVAYHPLEHVAFLHDASVLRILPERAVERVWRWSSALWFLYVVCDLPSNVLTLHQTLSDSVQDAKIDVDASDLRPAAVARARRLRRIKVEVLLLLLLRNFADLPLTVHFSLDGIRAVLSPRVRVALSLLSALLNLARLWRRADLPAAEQDDSEDD
jgi:hypothetical protein